MNDQNKLKYASCLVHVVIPVLYVALYTVAYQGKMFKWSDLHCVYEEAAGDGSGTVSGSKGTPQGVDSTQSLFFQGKN